MCEFGGATSYIFPKEILMKNFRFILVLLSVMSIGLFSACGSDTETITETVEVIKEVEVEKPSTLETVLNRGTLKCGVNDNLTGFGVLTAAGTFEGLRTYCGRAPLLCEASPADRG